MKFGASMFFTDYSMAPDALARALEGRGFDIVWAPEHSHIPLSRKSPFIMGGDLPKRYYDVMDPFVTLTVAALATKTLKVGTGVCLMAMKAIWTQSKAEYHGEFVNFDPMMTWPKPVQKPHPLILVGGAFPYSARRAVRYGDGWMPQMTAAAKTPLTELIPRFRQMAAEAGRDPATLQIAIGGQAPDVGLIGQYQELGVDMVSTSLESAKEDVILPILDHWAGIIRQVNG
jgi:alkanesulfonate monooxygenase SsuD/methylene tetrahydromethanopterin reductase-like flavin-dependent oxidoreductase (luciferase family)